MAEAQARRPAPRPFAGPGAVTDAPAQRAQATSPGRTARQAARDAAAAVRAREASERLITRVAGAAGNYAPQYEEIARAERWPVSYDALGREVTP